MEPTMGTMDLDGQLTQKQFHSCQVGRISNDFDVNEFVGGHLVAIGGFG